MSFRRMEREPKETGFDRLVDAVQVFLEHEDSRNEQDPRDLLDQHEDLGELLRPLVEAQVDSTSSGDAAGHDGDDAKGPRWVGEFRLIRELGKGGFGTVWEAEQESFQRRVALKLLAPHHELSTTSLERFRLEARAGGRVAHPGLVAVYAYGQKDGVSWIAQEMIEGGRTLADRLEEARRLPSLPPSYYGDTAELIARVADALQAAHGAGVIHRDIKPRNILLRPDGFPVVSDFGLARVEDALELSRSGDFAGTPFYMSPEQVAAGRMGIDHRTDVFSLGTTLYEALTLVRPFDGDTQPQVLHNILLSDPPDPARLRSRVPRDLGVICLKALEKDPDRRYQTMGEFVADIRRSCDNEPVHARAPSWPRRALKWSRRHRVLTASGSVAAVAFVAVTALLIEGREARAAAVEETRVVKHVLDFMYGLFESTDPGVGNPTRVTAVDLLDNGVESIRGETDLESTVRGRLLHSMGVSYGKLDHLVEAVPLLSESVEILEREIGATHDSTLIARSDLARMHARLGHSEEAREMFEDLAQVLPQTLGPDHDVTLSTLNDLGLFLAAEGDLKAGEELLRDVLERRMRALGPEAEGTLNVMANLAMVHRHRGSYAEAEALYLEAIETGRRTGRDMGDQLRLLNNLGILYAYMGRFDLVEEPLRESLEGSRELFGDQHTETLISMDNLAGFYMSRGRFEDAVPLIAEARAGFIALLGEEHSDTLTSTMNLSSAYRSLARYDEALALLLPMMETSARVLGDTHPLTLTAQHNLGSLHLAAARPEEARECFERALLGRVDALGADNAETLKTRTMVAVADLDLGRPTSAEPALRACLEALASVVGEGHPTTLMAQQALVRLLVEAERADEAAPLARSLLDRTPDADPSQTEREQLLARAVGQMASSPP